VVKSQIFISIIALTCMRYFYKIVHSRIRDDPKRIVTLDLLIMSVRLRKITQDSGSDVQQNGFIYDIFNDAVWFRL
jgi:hypothetical protein